ncbi:MAG: hypothetical protein ACKVX7_06745 [Planctomycetota bacterium]
MLQVDLGTIDVFTMQVNGQKIASVSIEQGASPNIYIETWVVVPNLSFPLNGSFWAKRISNAPTPLASLKQNLNSADRVFVVRAEITQLTAEKS